MTARKPLAQQNPAPGRHADEADALGWDREKHGRMADQATTPEDEPQTVPWTPGAED